METHCLDQKKYSIKCPNCQSSSRFKSFKLIFESGPWEIITTIQCPKCGPTYKTRSHGNDIHKHGGIKITCQFNSKQDLSRFVSLREMSIIKIKHKKVTYEYRNSLDEEVVVETILRRMIEELCEMFDICNSLELMGTYGNTLSVENLTKELSYKANKLDKSHESQKKAINTVLYLTEMLKNPNFKMEIHDDSGFSRVFPQGMKPSEINSDDLECYNDDVVIHKWLD